MEVEGHLALGPAAQHEVEVALDVAGDEDGGVHRTRTLAGGADLRGVDGHLRAHALPRDLHETELAEGQDGVLGAVAGHVFHHRLVEHLPVVGALHVDEVDEDDAAEVAQAQLPGHLAGGLLVDAQDGGLGVGGSRLGARVDVDDVHGLGVLDHQVGPAGQREGLAEGSLDLAADAVVLEHGAGALVVAEDLELLGRDGFEVALDVDVGIAVVGGDAVKGAVEQVAQDGGGLVELAEQLRRGLGLVQLRLDLLPLGDEAGHLLVEVGHLLALGGRAHDDAEVLGADAFHQGGQPALLLLGAHLLGDGHVVGEGGQHHVAPGDGDLAGEPRPLGGDGLLQDLHQQVVALGEHLLDLAGLHDLGLVLEMVEHRGVVGPGDRLLGELLERAELGTQVGVVQESLLGMSDVDEGRVQTGRELAHLPEEDVADREVIVGLLVVQLHEPAVLQDGDFHAGGRGMDDEFLLHQIDDGRMPGREVRSAATLADPGTDNTAPDRLHGRAGLSHASSGLVGQGDAQGRTLPEEGKPGVIRPCTSHCGCQNQGIRSVPEAEYRAQARTGTGVMRSYFFFL